MTLETTVINESIKVAQDTQKVIESSLKKAWSMMDAASEKKQPSEVLNQRAIQAIQGNAS